MNRAALEALQRAVRANIAAGADLLSERRMAALLEALLEEDPRAVGVRLAEYGRQLAAAVDHGGEAC